MAITELNAVNMKIIAFLSQIAQNFGFPFLTMMSGSPSPPGPSMPLEAIGSTSAASSAANNYARRTEDALLRAASREGQPHLHPRKINGALWFGIDPCVHKFIRTTWQGNYMGPWSSWKFVPQERKTNWWQTFVQNFYWESRFHNLVYFLWKLHTQTTICQRISKKKREGKKPKYIDDEDWTELLEQWATEAAIQRSQSAANSRTSDPDGKGMHKHCAGPQNFLKIEYDMMIASGLDQPPPFTDLVRKTHTRKDGTFIDERAKSLVLDVEEAVTLITNDDGSPTSVNQTDSSDATPTHILLNQEYLKQGKSSKGRIYGIGSVQYRDFDPSETVPASLQRNLDIDLRISGLEKNSETVNTNVETLKADMTTLKDDMVALKSEFKDEMAAARASLNVILQALGVNSATVQQVNHTQPSVPAATPSNPTALNATMPNIASTSTPPLTQAQQADFA
ncbi:PREDICTED: uncharacterized protein LOC104733767 [Camelina sativa]|uniref:Uncharacterized protein LOC104733767 n=1 Tax=Camelina sativa TaxID=90675 RepID=A0ABM0V6H5_CAMSA|nr:PREDICTED: uncharacterized protein LOC104733767 [Camelina sativa]